MSKEQFLAIYGDPTLAPPSSRMDWVALQGRLIERDEPFTKEDIFAEVNANGTRVKKIGYVYSHLLEWVKEGILVSVQGASGKVYLAAAQIE